jgi:hypothetical protein
LSLEFGVTEPPPAALPKSKAVPGVFGVFDADPNDANAPDPRPNAVDAPTVGDATLAGTTGDIVLKGLDRPCEEVSPPKRFDAEKLREDCSGLPS